MTSTAGAPARRAVSFWVPIPRGTILLRVLPLALAAALVACGSDHAPTTDGPRGVALVPDTQTVDGVLEMRHSADALERAPQWALESEPLVVFAGGDDPDFDLSNAWYPTVLADGRVVIISAGDPRPKLFGADGLRLKHLAQRGEGPKELRTPSLPVHLPGDTLLILDPANNRMNWITAESGIQRSVPLASTIRTFCFAPTGMLSNGRIVATGRCSSNQRNPDGTIRPDVPLVSISPDYSSIDTLRMIPAPQMVFFEVGSGVHRQTNALWVRLFRMPLVMVWQGVLVTANAEDGYTITVRDDAGEVTERIRVVGPMRAVTREMRDTVIARELAEIERGNTEGLSPDLDGERRMAREMPFADSLAAFNRLVEGADGTLWAVSTRSPLDSAWFVAAFRRDGTLLGRLTVPGGRMPVWFGRDRVMVREIDEDGVVRFGVYRVRGQ